MKNRWPVDVPHAALTPASPGDPLATKPSKIWPAPPATPPVSLAQGYLRGDRPSRSPIEITVTIPATSLRAGEADPVLVGEIGEMGESFLSPETARRLSCDAGVVFVKDERGVALSVGRKRRTIAGALKRALHTRDKTCTYPGCNPEMGINVILNRCHRFSKFVSGKNYFLGDRIDVEVRPRRAPDRSVLDATRPARSAIRRASRAFGFIPLWGFAVFLWYAMRRVDCRRCGVTVGRVPWVRRCDPRTEPLPPRPYSTVPTSPETAATRPSEVAPVWSPVGGHWG
ncbi:MAG TPA: DUF222 domain-containing protein [Kofleriaceae bacterium]|nr:DUF222 domain-containing protein [Kofleriaceae bacterium]